MSLEAESKARRALRRLDDFEGGMLYGAVSLVVGDGLGLWDIQGPGRAAIMLVVTLSGAAMIARDLLRQRAKRRVLEVSRKLRTRQSAHAGACGKVSPPDGRPRSGIRVWRRSAT